MIASIIIVVFLCIPLFYLCKKYITSTGTSVDKVTKSKNNLHGSSRFLEKKELDKISQPTYSFSATLANLFVIPEFKEHAECFKCGNYISVSINDNYRLDKVKILGFDIDYENPENFTVSFGNVRQGKEKNIFTQK